MSNQFTRTVDIMTKESHALYTYAGFLTYKSLATTTSYEY